VPLPFAGMNARRSILGIDNFISAALVVLNNPATAGETYLVADPETVTLSELFTVLRESQGRRPRLFYIPPKLFQLALLLANRKDIWERLGGDLVVDTSRLQALGWNPPVKTFEGLRAMLSAENKNGSENA